MKRKEEITINLYINTRNDLRGSPLFDAYRKFYGQPTNLKEAEQFLAARLNHNE